MRPWRAGVHRWAGDRSLPPYGDYRNASVYYDFPHGTGRADCDKPHPRKHLEPAGRALPPPPKQELRWPEQQQLDPNALREARSRILELIEVPIAFNGAGEEDLPSVEQAWSVHHTDALTRDANMVPDRLEHGHWLSPLLMLAPRLPLLLMLTQACYRC